MVTKSALVLVAGMVLLSGCSSSTDSSVDTSVNTSVGTSSTTASTTTTVPPPSATTTPSGPSVAPKQTYTYSVQTKGSTSVNIDEFVARTNRTLSDARGWSMGGTIRFTKVDSGGDFTIWLAAPSTMTSFNETCSPLYSCTVGRNVIINEDRWKGGSPELAMSVEDYRDMVVNHEMGHWLGQGHKQCPGAGQLAYVMQQQSKGGTFLGSCLPNPWPLASERETVAKAKGVTIAD